MSKADTMREYALNQIGAPYVFGARGQACTPAYRGGIRPSTKAAHPTIVTKCQALTGKRASCAGCAFAGHRCYDCRGLTYCAAQAAGLRLSGSGCTSQWADAVNWDMQGVIADMPKEQVCIVMRQRKGSKVMEHTALYLGDGTTVEASVNVRRRTLAAGRWTHYGILRGQDTEGGNIMQNDVTVRKGSRSADVTALQTALEGLGYTLTVDGIFGSKTDAALKQFQAAHGLEADGVCGAITWAAIQAMSSKSTTVGQPQGAKHYTVTIPDVDEATATSLLNTYQGATAAVNNP